MLMYNLSCRNYSVTSESLWSYYWNEIDDVDDNSSEGKPFKCKTIIREKISVRPLLTGNLRDANEPPQPPLPFSNTELAILLKYLSSFWM